MPPEHLGARGSARLRPAHAPLHPAAVGQVTAVPSMLWRGHALHGMGLHVRGAWPLLGGLVPAQALRRSREAAPSFGRDPPAPRVDIDAQPCAPPFERGGGGGWRMFYPPAPCGPCAYEHAHSACLVIWQSPTKRRARTRPSSLAPQWGRGRCGGTAPRRSGHAWLDVAGRRALPAASGVRGGRAALARWAGRNRRAGARGEAAGRQRRRPRSSRPRTRSVRSVLAAAASALRLETKSCCAFGAPPARPADKTSGLPAGPSDTGPS